MVKLFQSLFENAAAFLYVKNEVVKLLAVLVASVLVNVYFPQLLENPSEENKAVGALQDFMLGKLKEVPQSLEVRRANAVFVQAESREQEDLLLGVFV